MSSLSIRLPSLPDGIGLDNPPTVGTYAGFEVYPMPCFVRFSVPDPAATARWYVDLLGFGVMYIAPEIEGVPAMVHLRRRKYQDILLVRGEPRGEGNVHLDATGELEGLALRAADARPEGPLQTPYGPSELRLVDPHGNHIVFFAAPQRPTGSIDEAMARAVEEMKRAEAPTKET